MAKTTLPPYRPGVYEVALKRSEEIMNESHSSPSSSGATNCSHGGEESLVNVASSHDSAFAKERAEFWREKIADVYVLGIQGPEALDQYADECLAEFDERFGETAHAVGIKGENTGEASEG